MDTAVVCQPARDGAHVCGRSSLVDDLPLGTWNVFKDVESISKTPAALSSDAGSR